MRNGDFVSPFEVLMIEDNPGDARLMREAMRDLGLPNNLRVLGDGVEGLNYLYQRGKYTDAILPDVILLDLNLPGIDGRQVLKIIKADRKLLRIPVLVFSGSESEDDISKAYNLYANCYITKPLDLARYQEVVRAIGEFWLSVVTLSPPARQRSETVLRPGQPPVSTVNTEPGERALADRFQGLM